MKQILFNLALYELTQKCVREGVDCSGTHLVKQDKRYAYGLTRAKDGEVIARAYFYKNSAPLYTINK